jgi:hypothetical protein
VSNSRAVGGIREIYFNQPQLSLDFTEKSTKTQLDSIVEKPSLGRSKGHLNRDGGPSYER